MPRRVSVLCLLLLAALAAPVQAAVPGWSSAGSLATPRVRHRAVVLHDGRVLAIGGTNSVISLSSTELYDPATNSWRAAAPTIEPRSEATATVLLDGRVLVVGGAP